MSGMKIKLTVDNAQVRDLLGNFERAAGRAHQSALSRATKKIETELADRAYEKINLKKKDIRDAISVNGSRGEIIISGDAISLSRFLTSEPKKKKKSKGVSVKLWRDKEKVLYEGSFTAHGKGGNFQVFKREGASRLPIKKLHGKGLRDMWEIPKFADGIIEIGQAEYSERFISSFLAFVDQERSS